MKLKILMSKLYCLIENRLENKKEKYNQLYKEMQRKQYVVSQYNQIKRKKCKLPKVQQNKIIEEFQNLVVFGQL